MISTQRLADTVEDADLYHDFNSTLEVNRHSDCVFNILSKLQLCTELFKVNLKLIIYDLLHAYKNEHKGFTAKLDAE